MCILTLCHKGIFLPLVPKSHLSQEQPPVIKIKRGKKRPCQRTYAEEVSGTAPHTVWKILWRATMSSEPPVTASLLCENATLWVDAPLDDFAWPWQDACYLSS